ncbi:MAG: hypothetical protein JST32_05245 [Bacteroidetes bacterium]|nr:hypothetical protein [Bacteroidota bacterium]
MKQMRNPLFLVILFFIISVKIFAQSPDCKRFRNGMFKTTFQGNTDIINRSGSDQTEYFQGSTEKPDHFIVKWLDDCTYTLTPDSNVFAANKDLPKNIVFTVKIVNTTSDSYTQVMTDNLGKYNVTSVMTRIEFDMEMYIKGGKTKKAPKNN